MENANVSIVKGELTFEDKVIQNYWHCFGRSRRFVNCGRRFFSNLRDKMINSEDVTTGIHTEVGKNKSQWIWTL